VPLLTHTSTRSYLRSSKNIDKESASTLVFATKDYPGALTKSLAVFNDLDVNLRRIESRLSQKTQTVNFFVDIDLPPSHRKLKLVKEKLREHVVFVEELGSTKVPWFPVTMEEVDSLALLTLDAGIDLENPDHPGFHDEVYRKRRSELAAAATEFKFGDSVALMDYSAEELECWRVIYNKVNPLLRAHACDEYLEVFADMQRECSFNETNIPQLRDVNDFIYERSGFRLRPTAGLLSSRHFLNGLAFNTFFCTQYLRHHAMPLYTPEPDVVHELIGHAPLFANPEFARFSQAIGLASIGATDEQITQLARCYWFSVEFGLCKSSSDPSEIKVYGAGVLSSFGEMEHAMGLVKYADEGGADKRPQIRPWDPYNAAKQDFPITKYQPVYYLAESFADAKDKLEEFAGSLSKRFSVTWDDVHECLLVDANIRRGPKDEAAPGGYGD
jgi:phenylalanine-4-hydroxylase